MEYYRIRSISRLSKNKNNVKTIDNFVRLKWLYSNSIKDSNFYVFRTIVANADLCMVSNSIGKLINISKKNRKKLIYPYKKYHDIKSYSDKEKY